MKIKGNLRIVPKSERSKAIHSRVTFIERQLTEGRTDSEIAEILGIDRSSVPRILRENKIRKEWFALNKLNATNLLSEKDAQALFAASEAAGYTSAIGFLIDQWLTHTR